MLTFLPKSHKRAGGETVASSQFCMMIFINITKTRVTALNAGSFKASRARKNTYPYLISKDKNG
jgi:hypothetical protein